VRVLSNIGGWVTALVDRAATSWLSRTGGGEAVRQRELAILRRLVLFSSVALVAAPIGLSAVTSPAVALPAGVAMVCAAFLFSAVGSIALARQGSSAGIATQSAEDFFLAATPGLVFFLDPHGSVATVGGRDRRDFLAWMRDPKGRGFLEQVHVSDRILFLQALDDMRRGEDAASVDLRLDRPSVSRDQRQFAYLASSLISEWT